MNNVKRKREPYNKLKGFFVQSNVKQKEVAKLLNKSKSALNQNLNGTGGDFSVKEVRMICKEYNISADEFFFNQ